MMNIKGIGKAVSKALGKHAPEILTAVGVVGVVGGTVAVVKATKKSVEDIDIYMKTSEDEVELDADGNPYVPFKKKVQLCWKNYIASAAIMLSSIFCFVGGAGIQARRTAALTTAFNLSQERLREYRKKLHETLNQEDADKAENEIANKLMKKHEKTSKATNIPMLGEQLFYDPYSDRWFQSSNKDIYDACRELNDEMHDAPFDVGVSLNDLYDRIGLKPTRCGKLIGWNLHLGGIAFHPRGNPEISPDGRSSLVFDFDPSGMPVEGWDVDYGDVDWKRGG